MVKGSPSAWAFAPGLLLIGLGVGVMLTPSVNVVQSSFPDEQQGEISDLSRSVSNLGSSLGTAVALLIRNKIRVVHCGPRSSGWPARAARGWRVDPGTSGPSRFAISHPR